MTKYEIQVKIAEWISAGVPKHKVFAQLSCKGEPDEVLANLIACYAHPPLCAKYRVKVSFLVLWMLLRAAAASFLLISTRAAEIPTGFILFSVVTIVIPVLFAVGFWKNMANAYNAYIRLFMAEAPLMLYVVTPLGLALVIVLVLGLEALCAYSLRNRLFPDFAQESRTVGGKYMFSDFSE